MSLAGSLGLKSLFSLASLVGKDIVARSIELTQAAGAIAVSVVQGAYIALNPAGTHRILYNGTTMDFVLSNAAYLTINNSSGLVSAAQGSIATLGKYSTISPGDSTGTPGNAVINKGSGRSAFAAAASAVTITSSFATATSIVLVELQTIDGTLTEILTVVPAAGSFTVTGDAAATGTTNFGWVIFN